MKKEAITDQPEGFHVDQLSRMTKGWFVGDFEPTLYPTRDCEIAVKYYRKGDSEESHHHKIATEFTVITSGVVEMNGRRFVAGDIIRIAPGTSTDFRVIEDATTVVVKLPGAVNDKYVD